MKTLQEYYSFKISTDKSMDPMCHWECKPSTLSPETTETPEKFFCRSGSFATDMNMKGFFSTRQENKPCIILFFKAWELDSKTKFGIGCIGVIFLGFMVEACIALRRKIVSPSKRGTKIIKMLKNNFELKEKLLLILKYFLLTFKLFFERIRYNSIILSSMEIPR